MSDSSIEPGGAPPPQPNTLNPKVAAGAAVTPGMPVYAESTGDIGPAKADSATTAYALGLALINAANGERGQYRYSGPVQLPATADGWGSVLNTGTALIPGDPYYVSQASAGKITHTLPGSGIVCQVGTAISETTLLVAVCSRTVGG